MAVIIEHEKRKKEILEKAISVFMEEGYEDFTFQKIADRCNITRTTLYLYFKNKRELFTWSIKQLTNGVEENLILIIKDQSLSSKQCLKQVLNKVLDHCEENIQLFKVTLMYLIQIQKKGADVNTRVKRRLVRLHHLINTIIIRGQNNGEFKQLSVKDVSTLLYNLLETAIFHVTVLGAKDLKETRQTVEFVVDNICCTNDKTGA